MLHVSGKHNVMSSAGLDGLKYVHTSKIMPCSLCVLKNNASTTHSLCLYWNTGKMQIKWCYQWKLYFFPVLFLAWVLFSVELQKACRQLSKFNFIWWSGWVPAELRFGWQCWDLALVLRCCSVWYQAGSALQLFGLSAKTRRWIDSDHLARVTQPAVTSCFRLIHRHTDALACMEEPSRGSVRWRSHLLHLSG